MHLDHLLSTTIEPTTKSWPAEASGIRLDKIGEQGWSLRNQDLALPALVLRDAALRHNARWMSAFIERAGVTLCPHGKTTMAPQLFARQLEDGASGITVATVQQMRVCRRFGVPRVLMANQLIGHQAIREVLSAVAADPDFDFYCLVDSVDGVNLLAKEVADFGAKRPLQLLLEGGIDGKRTGCRSVAEALDVARAIEEAPGLALRGVEGFEGVFGRDKEGKTADKVRGFLDFLVEIARSVVRDDLFAPGPVILSAGGSAHFDQVTEVFNAAGLGRETEVILRSGCYFSHDSGMYAAAFTDLDKRSPELTALSEGLRPAIEVWAYVQSRPEPGRLLATMGKRDVSFDSGLPVPERWFRPGHHEAPITLKPGHATVSLNDQHAFLDVPEDSPLQVGDILTFGISHPCTTFDKWQVLYVVDDDDRVIEAIKTFF